MQNPKISHSINGLSVQQRFTDGYVDATALCKACGKKFNDYTRLDTTQNFLQVLSRSAGIPVDLLVIAQVTGKNENRGSYVHPQVAINLAQWCSPEFAVQVSSWVFQWMTTGGNPIWQENRASLKASNSKLMDAVKAYIDRHPELSENKKRWTYINVNDRLCKILTGNRVSKFCRDRSSIDFRSLLDTDTLKNLEILEMLTIRLIEQQDLLPLDAVKEAASRLLITVDRRLK